MSTIIDNKDKILEISLKNSLHQAESVDILTGYFYYSGFELLAEELRDKHVRILVGHAIDPKLVNELSIAARDNQFLDLAPYQDRKWHSYGRTRKREFYTDGFVKLFNSSSLSSSFDNYESQEAYLVLEDKLESGSLEIRMTAEPYHGKAFILTNKPEFSAYGDSKGLVFTGSSNFTYSGLIGQGELNQRLSDNHYYKEYMEHFDQLWNDSNTIDIQTSQSNSYFLDEIRKRLWIHATPTPYHIYIRILHELYKKEEDLDLKTPSEISSGRYSNFRYQLDAIKDAIDCVKKNNGVIVADVVGLGKSIIASAVAYNLNVHRTFVIAPPHLNEQWKDYVQDFGIRGAIVESSGKLEALHNRYATSNQPALFIIDEAHRYRNELTQDYQFLHQLTRSHKDNKVILLTATPYNNKPQDLFAMVKLFQSPNRSTIHSVDNLSIRFRELIVTYRKLEREGKKEMTDHLKKEFEKLSANLRALVNPVIIRRSRIDLEEIKEYADDLKRQNISFPKVVGPQLVEYDLDALEERYISTLEKLVDEDEGFIGARYKSVTYLIDRTEFAKRYRKVFDETDLKSAQINLALFMRRLLVMRFESSIYAFKVSLEKMIASLETMSKWWDAGYVPIFKEGELPEPDDFDFDDSSDSFDPIIGEPDEEEEVKKKAVLVPREMFREEFIFDVERDLSLLRAINENWFADGIQADPKQNCVEGEISALLTENKDRKIVIYTSYADTADWVTNNLIAHGYERTLKYTGSSPQSLRRVISENFDASYDKSKQKNDYDIIVATDALSEGFNLHRAGIIINYDIPYNPTRVIQRIGRINRINKKVFDEIYILNFFPTEIGSPVTNIKNITKLKMLLINFVIGSDTKTLTKDEDLQSFFQRQVNEADESVSEVSWDNEYRNTYNEVKHDTVLLDEILAIPERSRIVREDADENLAISFAKRGNGSLFALMREGEFVASILPPEQVLPHFRASPNEKATSGDKGLENKFSALRQRITERHPLPKIEGRRRNALEIVKFLSENYSTERDYLHDLLDSIILYDDLSDGELKYIAQIELNGDDLQSAVESLMQKFPPHYLDVIRERANAVDQTTEIIMFTEDLRL